MTSNYLAALLGLVPLAALSQAPAPLTVGEKFSFHAKSTVGPLALLGDAVYAGGLQLAAAPDEWRQGAAGFGKRFVSTLGYSSIHNALGFGLDTVLHQDPRYFRAGSGGFWHRAGHAVRGTIFTRTDRGGETLATWQLGSTYGAAFLSNQWYPDRLNTVKLSVIQGTVGVGLEIGGNICAEFWPDIKRKLFRRK